MVECVHTHAQVGDYTWKMAAPCRVSVNPVAWGEILQLTYPQTLCVFVKYKVWIKVKTFQ